MLCSGCKGAEFVFSQDRAEGGSDEGGSGASNGGRGGNSGVLFDSVDEILKGSGRVEKVGPAKEMLSSSCPPKNPDDNRQHICQTLRTRGCLC